MSLESGARLGPYEVIAPLGAGGMGEVYRGRDTKLGRDVAIKILSDAFALDPDRVARFEREAQLLAALNHSHIAAIYGLEEAAGTRFLILELVEGETLAQRLKGGSHAEPGSDDPADRAARETLTRPTHLPYLPHPPYPPYLPNLTAGADEVCARFTTVTVTEDGYCFEWCTALCATTPLLSS